MWGEGQACRDQGGESFYGGPVWDEVEPEPVYLGTFHSSSCRGPGQVAVSLVWAKPPPEPLLAFCPSFPFLAWPLDMGAPLDSVGPQPLLSHVHVASGPSRPPAQTTVLGTARSAWQPATCHLPPVSSSP